MAGKVQRDLRLFPLLWRHGADGVAPLAHPRSIAHAAQVLTAVFISSPALKRSTTLYLPFPLAYLLSHLFLLSVRVDALLSDGTRLLEAVSVAQSFPRLYAYAAVVGMSYGFCASLMQARRPYRAPRAAMSTRRQRSD